MDYVEAFKNLRTNNKWGRKSPHKAVLMLTVIELYEKNVLTDNGIRYDETLKSTFLKVWNRVLPDEPLFHPEAYLPFWYLQSDSFWHIVPIRGKEDILSLMRDTNIKPSEAKLNESVRCAELDEDLYFLMTIASGRSSLKRALLETYTQLSEYQIDRLAESRDNVVDHSLSAMDEYEQMLSSKNTDEREFEVENSTELEKQFKELSDDLQIALSYEYFAFLKNHLSERDMLREICPNVYALYDCIIKHPVQKDDISPSLSFIYDNFLCDLKIALMSENGSMDLIDKIEVAIAILRGDAVERDDVDKHFNYQEESNTEQRFEEDGEQTSLLSTNDEQHSSIQNYTIENHYNHCYIIDNHGERVFSSDGKLKIIDEVFYRVYYTNSIVSINIVRKDERDMYVLGKRIVSAHSRSPLYFFLDKHSYLEEIQAVRFDSITEEYHVLVGNRWYGSSGYYADLEQKEKDVVPDTVTEEKQNEASAPNELEIEHVYLDSSYNIVKTVTTPSLNHSQEKEESTESRKGKPWTQEEEERITHYFERGINTADIAERVGRTEVAIKTRLAKLGLIEYTYGEDNLVVKPSNNVAITQDDFKIENSYTRCCILNKDGEKVFSDDGKLKYIRGKFYRLNLKNKCFTMKDMQFNGEVWMKGSKKIVAYPWTRLYRVMDDALNSYDIVEDIVDSPIFENCQLKVNGNWYKYNGDLISDDSKDNKEEVDTLKQNRDRLRILKNPLYAVRKQAILRAMGFFRVPAKIKDVARMISRTAWGAPIKEDDVEEIIHTISNIESSDGKYILRKK